MPTPSFFRGALEAALQNWMWSSVIVTSMQRWTSSRRQSGDLRNDSHALIFLHSWGVKQINFTLLGNYLSATLTGNKCQLSRVVYRAQIIYLWSRALSKHSVIPPLIINKGSGLNGSKGFHWGSIFSFFNKWCSVEGWRRCSTMKLSTHVDWHSPLLCL